MLYVCSVLKADKRALDARVEAGLCFLSLLFLSYFLVRRYSGDSGKGDQPDHESNELCGYTGFIIYNRIEYMLYSLSDRSGTLYRLHSWQVLVSLHLEKSI